MSPLDLIILLPIAGAILMALGLPARWTAIGTAAANFCLALVVLVRFDRSIPEVFQFTASRPILADPELNFAVGIDGMSLVMLMLTVLVTLCAVAVSPAKPDKSPALYYASSLLISAGALGAFLSTDLFFFFSFHELALIPTFLMIGMFGRGENRAAAWRITIYLGTGSLILLGGLIALYLNLGGDHLSFNMLTLAERAADGAIPAATQEWIFLTLLLGFGILVSLFPFHSWAAPAYASAPTPTTMLHAGVLKNFGIYGLLRVALPWLPQGAQSPWIMNLLLILLLGNILFVGLVTIAQKRLDLMLGNSSVMHMGYAFLGIASYSLLGFNGAVLLMFAHGVGIALLFALSSKIEEKTGTLELSRLGGLGKSAPVLALTFGIAAFASIGLPGFANFASEILVFFAGFSRFEPGARLGNLEITTMLAVWGVVISAVYMLRAYRNIFQGESSPATASATDLALTARWPFLLLIAALLAVGLHPNLLLDLLRPATELIATSP